MSLKMQQHLAMKQQLRMTQQLQQAIKLLQLSRMELVSQIQQEMIENPTLEEVMDEPSRSEERLERGMEPESQSDMRSSSVSEASGADSSSGLSELGSDGQERREEMDWSAYLEYYQSHTPLPQNSYKGMITEELPSYEATLTAPETLVEHLLWQVRMSRLDEQEERIAAEIIGNLDEDGYLKGVSLEEIAEKLEADLDNVEYVLETVQEMDPVGVASRDLKECLTVQAEVHHADDETVYQIIQEHIPNLERKNYEAIARSLKVGLDEVLRAAKLISLMDPKPGRKFSDERPQYITPDIYVQKIDGDYRVILNEDGLPKLRVSPFYSQVVKQKDNGKEASAYIRDKLAGARWLIRSIHQRQRTIHKVTEAIVERQREFLDRGVNYLKPMVLKDIAEETGLHESTISRVTNKKYVHTPQGVFELKYFFNSRITRTQGDDLASESVKERIKQIISAEDARRPHSDAKIVRLLRDQNIKIARRTVAKYREAMGILSSTQRKSFF